MITQAELKKALKYNRDTGIFAWIINSGSAKVGKIAGSLDRNGYIIIGINGKRHLAHRLAWLYMNGSLPKHKLDHKNSIRSDNKIDNLREAPNSFNNFNVSMRSNNTSGYKGVCYFKQEKKWQAKARVNGKSYHLGLYATPELASDAYKEFTKIHHGEFYKNI